LFVVHRYRHLLPPAIRPLAYTVLIIKEVEMGS
jgi:hypothetical protein